MSSNYALNTYGTPSEGLYVESNRFETGILARNGTTRMFMTNNYVGGDCSPTGPVSAP
jgi:hypothetical protein